MLLIAVLELKFLLHFIKVKKAQVC